VEKENQKEEGRRPGLKRIIQELKGAVKISGSDGRKKEGGRNVRAHNPV